MMTSITSHHQWCNANIPASHFLTAPESAINSYSPMLRCQDVRQAHWLVTESYGKTLMPFISGLSLVAQPLASGQRENAPCPQRNKKTRSWEQAPAGSRGEATLPSLLWAGGWFRALVAGLCQMERTGVREGTQEWKRRSGWVAILQQLVIKEEQPQREREHEKGDADKAVWFFLQVP